MRFVFTFLLINLLISPAGTQELASEFEEGDSPKLLNEWDAHDGAVYALYGSKDGTFLITGGQRSTAIRWNTSSYEPFRSYTGFFKGHAKAVTVLRTTSDEKTLLTASADGTIKHWRLGTGAFLGSWTGHLENTREGVHLTENCQYEAPQTITPPKGAVRLVGGGLKCSIGVLALDISDNNRVVTSGADNHIKLWNIEEDKLLGTWEAHESSIFALAISPDGREVLSGGYDRMVRLWDPVTQEALGEWSGHLAPVTAVRFLPGGALAVSAGMDGILIVWDMDRGIPLQLLTDHKGPILSLDVSKNGQYLLSAGEDNSIKVWDLLLGRTIADWIAHSGVITAVAFSKVDGSVFSAGTDGHVMHWSLPGFDFSSDKPVDLVSSIHQQLAMTLSANTEGPKRNLAEEKEPPGPMGAQTAPMDPTLDVDLPTYKSERREKDFAIILGIEKYPTLPPAEHAERDAEAVKKHFLALGISPRNLIYLKGSKVLLSRIVKFVETWLPRMVKPDSQVYFYFAGNGAPDPDSAEAYIIPWDGDSRALRDTAYPVSRLYEKLGILKVKRAVVMLDASFNGTGGRSDLTKGESLTATKVDTGPVPDTLTVFSAAEPQQPAGKLDSERHGVFTYFLLRGLNGAALNENKEITAGDLFRYLKSAVKDRARMQAREQTPQLMGLKEDFAFR